MSNTVSTAMSPTTSSPKHSAAFSYASEAARLPLDSTSPSIRLLKLHGTTSATADDSILEPVSADIFVTPISTAPKFKALSYTWGTDDRTHHITLSGADFYVTPSLDSALRHLRPDSSGQSIILWIDQICINQDDEKEKTPQVNLMHQIYTGAEQVIVWLGVAADESDELLGFLSRIGDEAANLGLDFHRLDIMRWRKVMGSQNAGDPEEQGLQQFFDRLPSDLEPLVPALFAWCQRPWFSRVWVVQESALNPDTMFRCGHKSIDAEALVLAMALLSPRLSELASHMQLVADKLGPRILRDIFNPSSSRKLCLWPPQFEIRRRYQHTVTQQRVRGLNTFVLLRVLYVLNGTYATKMEDRIFGLLALAGDAERLGISANYIGTDVVALFSHVAASIMRDSGALDLLRFSQSPKDLADLPSWVPDWRPCLRRPYSDSWAPVGHSLFSASALKPARALQSSGLTLQLEGVHVDIVEEVRSSRTGHDNSKYENPLSLLADIRRLATISKAKNRPIYSDPGRREESHWRVPIGDMEYFDGNFEFMRRASDTAKMWYCELIDHLRPKMPEDIFKIIFPGSSMSDETNKKPATDPAKPSPPEESSRYLLCMAKMQEMKPFLTQEGYVGMGPSTLRPGDVVMVLIGAAVPFALRPIAGETNQFSLVGEVYCDGVMDGEIMFQNIPMPISLV